MCCLAIFVPRDFIVTDYHYILLSCCYIKDVVRQNTIHVKLKKSVKITIIVLSIFIALIAIAVGTFFLIISPHVNMLKLPNLDLSRLTSYDRTVTILDKDGQPIDSAFYDHNKIYVRLEDLPDYTPKAFVAIEDKRFYSHGGVDYKRIAGAAFSNIKSGSFREGASTITQQLIKNTHLSNEKTIKRKLSEMRLARQLEQVYDKDQILESYLNILYFGYGIHGLGTASRVMFNKPATELTVAQSAALASIINNPSRYSPYTNRENLDKRTKTVLKLMHEQHYLDDEQYENAINEQIEFCKNRRNQFINGLIKSACAEYKCSEKELFLRNPTFKTAYDPTVSEAARKAIDEMSDINGYIRVFVLDNLSGGIVCDETNTNKFIDMRRSPASAIKPFISYAPALENGYTPLTQIVDAPTDFDGYSPRNYKSIYRGYQSVRECLIRSSNIAAVTLLNDVGIPKAKSTAERFGIEFENGDNTLALALGGMEKGVTLAELANAYRTLANGGIFTPISYFDRGEQAYKKRAIRDDIAYLLTDMLRDCATTGTAKKLSGSGIIAAKTGTNGDENGNYDCYCIAYTPQNTIAIWFGAKPNSYIDNSITGAACCNIIKNLCDTGVIRTDFEFDMPNSVAYYEVDDKALRESHEVYLADPFLPKRYRRRELFSKKNLPIRKNIDYIDFFDRRYWFGNRA